MLKFLGPWENEMVFFCALPLILLLSFVLFPTATEFLRKLAGMKEEEYWKKKSKKGGKNGS